jgi:hypothetical protein
LSVEAAASFAFSAAAAVAFSSPAGFGAVADFGAAGAPAFGASEGAVGVDAGALAAAAVPDFGFAAVAGCLAAVVGWAAVPADADGFDAAAVPAEAAAVGAAAVLALGAGTEVAGGVVAFGAVAAALGFAVAAFGLGFAAAVPAFGFDAAVGFAAAGLAAVPAFGFAAVPGFAAAFVVADFGAPLVPAFGVLGLRVLVPDARVRAVRVAVGAAVPVLVPPARGAGAGVSTVVSGASS